MSNEKEVSEVAEEITPLLERLNKCKSRGAARKSIAGYCEDIGVCPTKFKMSHDERHAFARLK